MEKEEGKRKEKRIKREINKNRKKIISKEIIQTSS